MAHDAVTDVVTIRVRPFQRWLPQLLNAVAVIGDVAPEQLAGPRRTKAYFTLRQAYALAARDTMHKSFEEIGLSLGRTEHTSARYAYLNGQQRLTNDPEFRQLARLVGDVAKVIATGAAPTVEVEPELPL